MRYSPAYRAAQRRMIVKTAKEVRATLATIIADMESGSFEQTLGDFQRTSNNGKMAFARMSDLATMIERHMQIVEQEVYQEGGDA